MTISLVNNAKSILGAIPQKKLSWKQKLAAVEIHSTLTQFRSVCDATNLIKDTSVPPLGHIRPVTPQKHFSTAKGLLNEVERMDDHDVDTQVMIAKTYAILALVWAWERNTKVIKACNQEVVRWKYTTMPRDWRNSLTVLMELMKDRHNAVSADIAVLAYSYAVLALARSIKVNTHVKEQSKKKQNEESNLL